LTVPSVHAEIVATPLALDVTVDGAVPPPDVVIPIGIAATPLSNPSVTRTTTGAGTGCPTVPWRLIGETATSLDAAPGAEFTVIVTGARPRVEMLSVFIPAALPRVHVPTDVPSAFVVVGGLARDPPPATTLTFTATLLRPFPTLSFTTKTGDVGSGRPAVAISSG
jgi:hypothetical protein